MSQKIIITSLTSEGDGIGSLNGLKVFVPETLPGEEVEIEIIEKKQNYARGKKLALIKSSQNRQNPHCPLFLQCGGCQIMHLSYLQQLKEKQKRVTEALMRIGGLNTEVKECHFSPQALHYRNKIQLPLIWNCGTMQAGLYRKNSHDIIPIESCLIQNKRGNELLHKILPYLQGPHLKTLLIRNGIQTEEALIVLVSTGKKDLKSLGEKILTLAPEIKGVVENINLSSSNVVLGKRWNLLAGRSYIFEKLKDKTFKISAGAFFQVNTLQAEHLFRVAIELAEIKKNDVVWDAYCGVGTLALFASDHAASVTGTECLPSAIEDARENARLNGAINCSFRVGNAEEMIEKCEIPHVVFLNPPRKGCDEKLLRQIAEKEIKKIIYISCDPATLARDLKILVSLDYEIKIVQPFDMFPQTMHVETVVYLIK